MIRAHIWVWDSDRISIQENKRRMAKSGSSMHTYTGITESKLNVAEAISQIMPDLAKVHLENTGNKCLKEFQ
jgi:hypothetical protein